MPEQNLEDRISYIKEMAHIMGFHSITDGDMGDYRYLKFEDYDDPEKRMITIRAELYPDKIKTEIKFEPKPITFSRDVKIKINEALDVASMVDGLRNWLNSGVRE